MGEESYIISHRLYKMMDSKCNSLPAQPRYLMWSSQPGTLFRGNGSHPLSASPPRLTTPGGFNWTGLQPVLCSELLALALAPIGPCSHLEVDDLLLLHFGIIKIPITTVKVTLQKVKVKMMKKFQGY